MSDGVKFYQVHWASPAGFVVTEYDLVKETEHFLFTNHLGGHRMRKGRSLFRDREQALRECHRRNVQQRQERLEEIAHIDRILAEVANEIGELTTKEDE
jgi:hypothetical protein